MATAEGHDALLARPPGATLPPCGNGTTEARDLLAAVYEQLRSLAHLRLAALGPGQTLQATALVHEAWLRVSRAGSPGWDSRAHFFGAAARAMRDVLVTRFRQKASLKRGAGWHRVDCADVPTPTPGPDPDEMLTLNDALDHLEQMDALKAQVVMLRFFTGLTMLEVAEILGLSLSKVEREWRFARSWLQRRMEAAPAIHRR